MVRPRYYYLKRILWNLAGCDSIPNRPGSWARLRERLGRLTYNTVDLALPYHSQGGQDRFLHEVVFQGRRNGTCAEIGANDGVSFSNSLFFEKELGWTSVCVEPNPPTFEALKRNRPLATCIQACVGPQAGSVDFPVTHNAEASLYAKAAPGETASTVSIPLKTLNQVFSEANCSHLDYFSLDIEGGELETFCALDLDRVHVEVVGMEENEDPLVMDRRMKDLGFRFVGKVFVDRFYRWAR